MNNPPKSSPESPAKEQPGEQVAAPRAFNMGQYDKNDAVTGPASDVAAMVKRLKKNGMPKGSGIDALCQGAAALIEKLWQGWIPDDALSFCEDCGMYVVSKPPPPERP